jgi:hypothetical protein
MRATVSAQREALIERASEDSDFAKKISEQENNSENND